MVNRRWLWWASHIALSGLARYIGQFTQGVALGYHPVSLWGGKPMVANRRVFANRPSRCGTWGSSPRKLYYMSFRSPAMYTLNQ